MGKHNCGPYSFYPLFLALTVFPQIVPSQLPEAIGPLWVSLQLIVALHSQTSVIAFIKDLHMSWNQSLRRIHGLAKQRPQIHSLTPRKLLSHPAQFAMHTCQEEDQRSILDFGPKTRIHPILLPLTPSSGLNKKGHSKILAKSFSWKYLHFIISGVNSFCDFL